MHKYIPFFFLLISVSGISADFDVDTLPEKLAPRVKEFLDADTSKARGQMAVFSDEDLQKIGNAFKKDHSSPDQRLFWLNEELYRRNAERVAAERIRYLYYAVLAALLIIAGFTGLTYARTRTLGSTAPIPLAVVNAAETLLKAKKNQAVKKSKPQRRRSK